MTDSIFEQSLDRQLREYADGGVQPFDRYAIAEGLIRTRRRRLAWLPALGRPVLSPSIAIVVIGLLLALLAAAVVGAWLVRTQLNQPPGRNGVIAFSLWDLPERPYNHLHLIQPDGTGDREIAQGTAASFSRDGSKIAYFTGWGAGEPNLRLVVAEADGANAREVSPYQQSGFAYSPDGKWFAVIAGGNRTNDTSSDPLDLRTPGSIWLVATSDGTARELVPALTEPDLRNWDVVWSPDSRYIATSVMQTVTSGDNEGEKRIAMEIYDVQTGQKTRVTERLGTDSPSIAWSPDSKRLAFLARPDGAPSPVLGDGSAPSDTWWIAEDIFVVNIDGTGETNVTNSAESEQSIAWSPDGSAIAFLRVVDTEQLIVSQEVDGKSLVGQPLIGPAAHEFRWSPDALRFVYALNVETSPPNADQQTFEATIRTIDAKFTEEPFVVGQYDYSVGGLSWQWLKP